MLSARQRTLLDDASAEAKRLGHGQVTPLHLAAALARRDAEQFEAVFGSGASTHLRQRLTKGQPAGDEAAVLVLLEKARGSDDGTLLGLLLQELGPMSDDHTDEIAGASEASEASEPPSGPDDPVAGRTHGLLRTVAQNRDLYELDDLARRLIALLSMRRPATPLLVGATGSGKTSAAEAVAALLADPDYTGPLKGMRVVQVATEAVLAADIVHSFDRALDGQQADEILFIDDIEALLALGSPAAVLPMLPRLRGAVSDPEFRVMAAIDGSYWSRLEALDRELVSMVTRVDVPNLPVETLWRIAQQAGSQLSEHHGVEIPETIVRLSASPPSNGICAHPGLLIDRLDRASAQAAVRGDHTVTEADLPRAEAALIAPLDADALCTSLGQRIRGQDHVLGPVAARLALTRAGLDLRPGRPDGVFLFVGPTGVGKTELALAICKEVYDDEQRLIRLDMSEYAEEWALSRLIGPQPGYAGFTEPDAWLTTRIVAQPNTVLLLDEIEKAHPSVWNTFLQVFDAGRLSDSRGAVADFDRVVVVMTSNLGARSFSGTPLGFAAEDGESSIDRGTKHVVEAVQHVMAPELVNRLDEILVFHPLSTETIREIAAVEIERMCERVRGRGYVLHIGSDVQDLIAETGYDPAYGARHLQRNVERLLLAPLARAKERELYAQVVDGHVVWESAARSAKEKS